MGHHFFVMQHQGAWRIQHNGQFSAPFDDPESAIRKVVVFARWSGQQSQVTVQGQNNVFQIEWTSDRDLPLS
jgi:hypothetical protein